MGLDVAMSYEIVQSNDEKGQWRVSVCGYMYSVQTDDGTEVLAYHWHPLGNSPETRPHLHIGAIPSPSGLILTKKMHVPTGRIALESVLRLCIHEFGVRPLRDDWAQILADGEDLFTMWRTWQ